VEEAFEVGKLERFFDVKVYAVQPATSDELSERLVVSFELWADDC